MWKVCYLEPFLLRHFCLTISDILDNSVVSNTESLAHIFLGMFYAFLPISSLFLCCSFRFGVCRMVELQQLLYYHHKFACKRSVAVSTFLIIVAGFLFKFILVYIHSSHGQTDMVRSVGIPSYLSMYLFSHCSKTSVCSILKSRQKFYIIFY